MINSIALAFLILSNTLSIRHLKEIKLTGYTSILSIQFTIYVTNRLCSLLSHGVIIKMSQSKIRKAYLSFIAPHHKEI